VCVLGYAPSPLASHLAHRYRLAVGKRRVQLRPTTAPSPIAAPTRLTDPDRTSPAANTPRTLVSSGNGRPGPSFDRPPLKGTSDPVGMKFLLSNAIPLPLSQAVAGSAPMNRNTWRIGLSVSSPVKLLRQRTRSNCPSRLP
jgi:hypothetical protein